MLGVLGFLGFFGESFRLVVLVLLLVFLLLGEKLATRIFASVVFGVFLRSCVHKGTL